MKIAKFNIMVLADGEAEAQAANLEDSHAMWVKFIFTDDLPNANKQGIRQEEFASIIDTGVHKPFKKVIGGDISPGHADTMPIGTIADMRHEENTIVGLAAVWEPEFPAEASAIRKSYANKEPLDVSWELYYKDSETDDEGVEWLQGVSTRGVTLVSIPAYDGRTPVLAVATNEKEGKRQMELDEALKELEKAQKDKVELEGKLAESKASLEELLELKKEVEDLRQFKVDVEAERVRSQTIAARMAKFAEAGIEMTSETFEADADKWLSLDDEAFDFILAQLVNSKPTVTEAAASVDGEPTEPKSGDAVAVFKEFLQSRKEEKQEPK